MKKYLKLVFYEYVKMNYLLFVFTLIALTRAEDGWIECGVEYEFKIAVGNSWINGGFNEAQQLCGEEGGELAILKNKTVATCIMNINVDFQSVLLGLVPNSQSTKGFAWTDGTLVEDGYQNWMDGEPDNGANQDCVIIIDNNKQWKDDACAGPKHYACQRSTDLTTPTTTSQTTTTTMSQPAESNNPSQSVSGQPIFSSSQPDNPDPPKDYKELYSETMELLIIVSSVSGGVIIILVVVILVLIYIRSAAKDSSDDSDWGTMDKSRRSTTLGSQGTNMTYMWNSLSYADDARRKRDIPRPSVVGSTSTHSYMNRRYSRRPYSSVDLGYLPEEDKAYSTNGDTEHGEFNHMYDKLNM